MGFLTKEEKETLKKNLLDFISRVSSVRGAQSEAEIYILPDIISLLYETDCGLQKNA